VVETIGLLVVAEVEVHIMVLLVEELAVVLGDLMLVAQVMEHLGDQSVNWWTRKYWFWWWRGDWSSISNR
jgi:choline-glycine betaine transporter